jgi:hypothetical protein
MVVVITIGNLISNRIIMVVVITIGKLISNRIMVVVITIGNLISNIIIIVVVITICNLISNRIIMVVVITIGNLISNRIISIESDGMKDRKEETERNRNSIQNMLGQNSQRITKSVVFIVKAQVYVCKTHKRVAELATLFLIKMLRI